MIMWLLWKKKIDNVGKFGENYATRYLKKRGYKILARNWYNAKGKRLGEIDIVARRNDGVIVFVEVKTRVVLHGDQDILPEEQITRSKLHKLERIAQCYMAENSLWADAWQCDAIAVVVKDDVVVDVRYLENIYF